MELPTALTHEIHQLLSGLSIDDAPVVDPIAKLHIALGTGIDSYRGFQLEMVDHGHPVTLTWFVAGTVAGDLKTSLHLPLTALLSAPGEAPAAPDVAAADPDSITFYASTPGALVDFAADITYALHLPPPRTGPVGHAYANGHTNGHTNGHAYGYANAHTDGHHDGPATEPAWRGVTLDGGVPPTTMVSGLAGVVERSAINRAIGVLLAEGYETEPAFRELGRRAAEGGHSLTQAASELLARVSTQ